MEFDLTEIIYYFIEVAAYIVILAFENSFL